MGNAFNHSPFNLERNADWERLREIFAQTGYHRENLMALTDSSKLGDHWESGLALRRVESYQRLDVLLRLFFLVHPVSRDDAATALTDDLFNDLIDLGFLGEEEEGIVKSRAMIIPYQDLLVINDPQPELSGGTFDAQHVVGVGAATMITAMMTPRGDCTSFLDLGTGNGFLSLLAAPHCGKVVATDINPRALNFASLATKMNFHDNVEIRDGSFFEPVKNETFDLVTCNPPFVISPENGYLFRDSEMANPDLVGMMIEGTVDHIAEGGHGVLLLNWAHPERDEWAAPVLPLLEKLDCDAFLFQLRLMDSISYAAAWLEMERMCDSNFEIKRLDSWLEYYREQNIEWISYVIVVLRKRSGAKNWVRHHHAPAGWQSGERWPQVKRMFENVDLLESIENIEELAEIPLALAPEHVLEYKMRGGAGDWITDKAQLRLDGGFSFTANTDRKMADLLAHCDGARPFGDAVTALSEKTRIPREKLLPGCCGAVVQLLEGGFLMRADNPETQVLLAKTRHKDHLTEAAANHYQMAISMREDDASAHYGLGCLYSENDENALALGYLRKAVELDPAYSPGWHNLAKSLYLLGDADAAMENFQRSIKLGGGNLPLSALATIIPGCPTAGPMDILNARKQWAESLAAKTKPLKQIPKSNENVKNRIRIGYVSSFFDKDNWMKPVWGLINAHDRESFEIHLFSDCRRGEIEYGYQERQGDIYHDISTMDNREAAELIQKSDIDLLIDLNGFSRDERLQIYFYRPAPVIAAWFNMYASSGMDCIDYIIGDESVVKPDEQNGFSEKIITVPNSYLTFNVDYPCPEVAPLPCLENDFFTFACLGSQYKITPEVIGAWSKILNATPNSRLLLKNSQLASSANREFLIESFQKHGIESNRLILEGPEPHFDFLKAYAKADLALDVFPYNGGTTTMEALWQGVPVLTFAGDRWASRTSASILNAANLDEFVAPNLDQYIEKAIELAKNQNKLSELRAQMRQYLKTTPAMDSATFAKEMETAYKRILG